MTEKTITLAPNREIQDAYVSLGMLLHQAGDFEEAEAVLQKAIARNPEWVMPYLALGMVLSDTEQSAEAEQMFKQALVCVSARDTKTQAAIYSALGIALQKQGRNEEAREAFKEAFQRKPDDGEILDLLVETLDDLQEFEDALGILDRVLENDTHNVSALVRKSNILLRMGRPEEALEFIIRALALDPQLDPELAVEAYTKIGELFKRQGKEEEAQAAFQKAEEAAAGMRESGQQLLKMAVIQHQLGNLEQAEALLLKAADLDPESRHVAYTNLGTIHTQQERYDEAQAMFAKAIEVDPQRSEPYIGLAQVLEAQQQWAEAVVAHRRVAEQFVEIRGAALEHVGDLYRDRLKDLAQAEAAYQESWAAEPGRVSALRGLVHAYEEFEKYDEAIAAHRQIAEMSAETDKSLQASALTRIAGIYLERLSEPTIARQILDEAVSINPDEVNTLIPVARCSEVLGNQGEADQAYDHMRAILESKPEAPIDATALRRLAWVYYKMGEFDNAVRLCQQIDTPTTDIDKARAVLIEAAISYLRDDPIIAEKMVIDVASAGMLNYSLVWEARHDIRNVALRFVPDSEPSGFDSILDKVQIGDRLELEQ